MGENVGKHLAPEGNADKKIYRKRIKFHNDYCEQRNCIVHASIGSGTQNMPRTKFHFVQISHLFLIKNILTHDFLVSI